MVAEIGRPSDYEGEKTDQIAKTVCSLGGTLIDVAEALGVSDRTVNRWAKSHESFCRSLKIGKEPADEAVKQSLFKRALGYEYEETKTVSKWIKLEDSETEVEVIEETKTLKALPPDTTACIFWLKNRDKDNWRSNPEAVSEEDEIPEMSVVIGEVDARNRLNVESDSE